jgi:hypothetical protein
VGVEVLVGVGVGVIQTIDEFVKQSLQLVWDEKTLPIEYE